MKTCYSTSRKFTFNKFKCYYRGDGLINFYKVTVSNIFSNRIFISNPIGIGIVKSMVLNGFISEP